MDYFRKIKIGIFGYILVALLRTVSSQNEEPTSITTETEFSTNSSNESNSTVFDSTNNATSTLNDPDSDTYLNITHIIADAEANPQNENPDTSILPTSTIGRTASDSIAESETRMSTEFTTATTFSQYVNESSYSGSDNITTTQDASVEQQDSQAVSSTSLSPDTASQTEESMFGSMQTTTSPVTISTYSAPAAEDGTSSEGMPTIEVGTGAATSQSTPFSSVQAASRTGTGNATTTTVSTSTTSLTPQFTFEDVTPPTTNVTITPTTSSSSTSPLTDDVTPSNKVDTIVQTSILATQAINSSADSAERTSTEQAVNSSAESAERTLPEQAVNSSAERTSIEQSESLPEESEERTSTSRAVSSSAESERTSTTQAAYSSAESEERITTVEAAAESEGRTAIDEETSSEKTDVNSTSESTCSENIHNPSSSATVKKETMQWSKSEIILVIGIIFVLNVINLIIVILCVFHIANRNHRWERPPFRFGSSHRYTHSSPAVECVRAVTGRDLASDMHCTSGENTPETLPEIAKEGWCIPFKEEKEKEIYQEDTGV